MHRLPRFGKEVQKLMELTPAQKETVRHEFDRLCRMVLRGEAIDYDNHIAWRSKHETSLSWLSESQEGQLGVLDEYPCERFCFQVQGYTIPIRSEILANALVKLSEKKRDIILLAYFLDMTDQEIADKLGMVRRTVNYKHTQSLKKLRNELEVDSGGRKTE